MLESDYQKHVIDELNTRFPNCIVLKNDPRYKQGIPDLIVLFENKWAALECKRSAREKHQANQDWYVECMNQMSYASFIYPENEEDVFNDLQFAFKPRRSARSIKRI